MWKMSKETERSNAMTPKRNEAECITTTDRNEKITNLPSEETCQNKINFFILGGQYTVWATVNIAKTM